MNQHPHVVGDYMSKTPHSIGADQPLARARDLMLTHRIRHLPVLRGGELVGILTERDLAWLALLDDQGRDKTRVEDAMTPSPYVAAPSAPLGEVAAAMGAGKFGAAIVAEHGKVVGVFTTTDAMRALAEALGATSA